MSSPALALIGSQGEIEHSTQVFRRRYEDRAELYRNSPQLESVLAGSAERASLSFDDGIDAEFEAVTDTAGVRHALITLRPEDGDHTSTGPNELLSESLDGSRALIWLKDLEGNYLRVNTRFTEMLGATTEEVRGKSDTDLPAARTVDGPRALDRDPSLPEPLELEYSVPQFDGRPAMIAIRFAVRDPNGEPVAICGVAAPVQEARIARDEAEWLTEIERCSARDASTVRIQMLQEWGVVPSATGAVRAPASAASEGSIAVGRLEPVNGDDIAPPRVEPRLLEEHNEVREAAERARHDADQARADADNLRSEADAARRESAEALLHAERLERDLEQWRQQAEHAQADSNALRARLEQSEAEAHQLRARLEEAEADHRSLRARLEEAEADHRSLRIRMEETEAAAADARRRADRAESERVDADAARLQAEGASKDVVALRAELASAKAEAEAERSEAVEARRRAESAAAEASAARAQSETAGKDLAALRAELATAKSEAEKQRSAAVQAEQGTQSAESARAAAETARLEAETARVEAESARLEAQSARVEVESARAEAASARVEAESARADAEAARADAASARAESEAARAGAEAARAQAAAAHAQVETARAEGERARTDAEAARSEAVTSRSEADAARAEVESARAELTVARSDAESARVEAELALAEAESARAEAETARAAAEEVRTEAAAKAEKLTTLGAELAAAQAAAEAERAKAADAVSANAELRHELERHEADAASRHESLAAERANALREAIAAERERTDELMHAISGQTGSPPPDQGEGDTGPGRPTWTARAQRVLVEALAGAEDWPQALDGALAAIGGQGGWTVATAWMPDAFGTLRSAGSWTAVADRDALAALTPSEHRLGAGSVAAQAIHSPSVSWLADLDGAGDERLSAAAARGLRSGVLVPVRAAGSTIALLELLTRDELAPDPATALALEGAALQVGRFAHRLTPRA